MTISSICSDTVLFFRSVRDGIYFESSVPTEVDLTIKDKKDQDDGGTGFSLCGRRSYEVITKETTCTNYEKMTGKDRNTGSPAYDVTCEDTAPDEIVYADDGQVFLQFPVPTATGSLAGVLNNIEIEWRVRVSLEEYPNVDPVELVFSTYKMKACNRQQIISKYRNKNNPRLLSTVIGKSPSTAVLDLVAIENDYSFEYFGRTDLANKKLCGLIAYEVWNYDF